MLRLGNETTEGLPLVGVVGQCKLAEEVKTDLVQADDAIN